MRDDCSALSHIFPGLCIVVILTNLYPVQVRLFFFLQHSFCFLAQKIADQHQHFIKIGLQYHVTAFNNMHLRTR